MLNRLIVSVGFNIKILGARDLPLEQQILITNVSSDKKNQIQNSFVQRLKFYRNKTSKSVRSLIIGQLHPLSKSNILVLFLSSSEQAVSASVIQVKLQSPYLSTFYTEKTRSILGV